MKHFYILCCLLVIVLGILVCSVKSLIFPIDLVRVVLSMPSTPVINTPSIAWYIFLMGLAIEALAFYNGLPRTPAPAPIRRREVPRYFPVYSENINVNNYGQTLNLMADNDVSQCLQRFLCHLGATKPEELSFFDKIIINFIIASGSEAPPWDYSLRSPRKPLIDALQIGFTSQCWTCCETIYSSCNLTSEELIRF